MDKVFSALFIILLMPLMALIVLAIRLDSAGPVLFRQKRSGFNDTPFDVYKFRTMYHNKTGDPVFKQAKHNDPRITRVGKFLRKSSLDELPQLFNVWEGTMSLVGPRPHPIVLDEQFTPLVKGYRERLKVKPGITGWAQVNGWRGETEDKEKMRIRVAHDLYYIENWSMWFDFRILFMTIFVGWVHRNAY